MVDAGVEGFAVWVEADAEDSIALERVASGLPGLGHRLSGGEADFDGADEFGQVVGVDLLGGFGVEASEDSVQPVCAFGCFGGAKAVANFFGALRGGEESVDEGAEVEAGSSGDDGEFFSGGDLGEGGAGEAAVVSGGEGFGGVGDVDEVMRNLAAFG